MSLAATLAAGGMRPASFLPTIKCSSCGNEIEISAMGDHDCEGIPESPKAGHAPTNNTFAEKTPESPKAGQSATNNPYALRPVNSNNFQPAQPSPLQFDTPSPPVPMSEPAPQTRQRAPTFGSSQSNQRTPRPALPRINADMANKPFLAPLPPTELPISPASSRSGSSLTNRPPPLLRSMTSPMPRLWDPRPPSPELSANLDCAFPPFPMPASSSRRPSTSSGRKTPNGSERGPSRSSSRQGHKIADFMYPEPRSPLAGPVDNLTGHANGLKNGPFESTSRRPSTDDRRQQEPRPLDRRRPSSPGDIDKQPPPLLPPSTIESHEIPSPPKSEVAMFEGLNFSTSTLNSTTEKKVPPERPARPTNSLTPSLLDTLRKEQVSPLSTFPVPPLPRSPERSNTFPLGPSDQDHSGAPPALSRMRSEPALRGSQSRPSLPDTIHSEPLQIPQSSTTLPTRGASKNETRMDYRLHDAPPVPKPVQVHRSSSLHRPSGSDSSGVSSVDSLRMTNSSGPSPVTSASSSVDVFSPLAQEMGRHTEDIGAHIAGLNVKSKVRPGERAEQPKANSPPRNFARPAPTKEVSPPFEESPVIPSTGSWPLESPMDPVMKDGQLEDVAQGDDSHASRESSAPGNAGLNLNFNLSPAAFSSDEYDPYRAYTPQAKPEPPQPQPSNDGSYFKAHDPNESLKPDVFKPSQSKPTRQGRPRSRTESGRPLQPPPMPQEPPQMQLSRRPTVGGKSSCRGCGHLIEGKSVKAADGRLTGRWHKSCFVCKTCEQPFANAEFYVLNNNPYCEQHYHEKNRSVCFGCRKGIEGQYLETKTQDQRGLVVRKYHPRCFTCLTCKKTLTDDYFDVHGKVYCETHAMATMRAAPRKQGPGSSISSKSGNALSLHGSSGLKRTTKMMTTK